MSRTPSIGVVGPSYWLYMAALTADCLEKVVRRKRIEFGVLQKGVHLDVLEFFRLVLPAAGELLPENPPASINAYIIAAKIVRKITPSATITHQEIEEIFKRYLQFCDRLQVPADLTDEEVETAENLRKFFIQLCREGENEAR